MSASSKFALNNRLFHVSGPSILRTVLFAVVVADSAQAATIVIPGGGDLPAAISAANFGDTIVLPAGATWDASLNPQCFSNTSVQTQNNHREIETQRRGAFLSGNRPISGMRFLMSDLLPPDLYEDFLGLWHFALRLLCELLRVAIVLGFVLAGTYLKTKFLRLYSDGLSKTKKRNRTDRKS